MRQGSSWNRVKAIFENEKKKRKKVTSKKMACTAKECGACRGTKGCGWNGSVCGPAGDGYRASCAHQGGLVTPAPKNDSGVMARLGEVGYVDLHEGLKRVPASAVTYGAYERYDTQMTGTKMRSCRPTLKYGDSVVVLAGDKAAARQRDGRVLFQASATTFLLRPPVGVDREGEIRYGDSVVLATSITAANACGVYGCEVGKVVNGLLEVGPGGETGGTALTLEAPEGYGGAIYYGGPVVLSAKLAPPGKVMEVGQWLNPKGVLESPSGRYRLVYNADGTVGVYGTDQRVMWASGTPHRPGRLVLTDGALVAETVVGHPAWDVRVHGRGPYTLRVTDKGSAQIRGAGGVLWSTPEDPQPVVVEARVFGRLVHGRMVFGGRTGTRFVLDTRPGKKCDVGEVEKLCGPKCAGFLYSENDATWQPLSNQKEDYRKADTMQQVMLKAANVKLGGLCPSGAAEVVEEYGTPHGVVTKCGPMKTPVLPKAYEAVEEEAKRARVVLKGAVGETKPKLKELAALSREKDPTAAAQAADWLVVNGEFKSRAVVWGVVVGLLALGATKFMMRK